MKRTNKILCVILAFAILVSGAVITTISTSAEGSVIGTRLGNVSTGTWDHGVAKEYDGTSIKIEKSGDCYGYVFENLTPGVYKIGLYLTVSSMDDDKRLRVSPRVSGTRVDGRRCWIDWWTTEDMAGTPVMPVWEETDNGKILIVSVITVPEGYSRIDVGFWQDEGAYIGTMDKVTLTTGNYKFTDNDGYTLVEEKTYNEYFREDPGMELYASYDTWVSSVDIDISVLIEKTAEFEAIFNAMVFGDADDEYPQEVKDACEYYLDYAYRIIDGEYVHQFEINYLVDYLERAIKLFPLYTNAVYTIISEIYVKINYAYGLIDNAVEGSETGNYPEGSITKLENVIDSAFDVVYFYTDSDYSVEYFQAVLESLNNAIAEFETSVITKGALIPGLNSIWYKPIDENGDIITENGDIFKDLIGIGSGGQSSEDVKHFDSSYDKLFNQNNLEIVASSVMNTFEVQGADFTNGFDLNDKAADLDIPVKGDGEVDALLIKYDGYITASKSGVYKLTSKYIDNGCVIEIDCERVFEYWAASSWMDNGTAYLDGEEFILEEGVAVPITVYYLEQDGGQVLQFDVYQDGELMAFSDAGFILSLNDGVNEPKTEPEPKPDPKPEPEPKPIPVPKEPESSNPKTGSIIPYATVIFISVSVLGTIAAKKRRYTK